MIKDFLEAKEWCKNHIYEEDRKNLLTKVKSVGMHDCVADWCGYDKYGWIDFRDALLEITKPVGGGRRVLNTDSENYKLLSQNNAMLSILPADILIVLKYFDIYLCTDGILRYRFNKKLCKKTAREMDEYRLEQIEKLRRSLESDGYVFRIDEENGPHYFNESTGDIYDWNPELLFMLLDHAYLGC